MEPKEMVQTMLWAAIDGLAVVWILGLLADIMTDGVLAGALLLMAEAIGG